MLQQHACLWSVFGVIRGAQLDETPQSLVLDALEAERLDPLRGKIMDRHDDGQE